MKWTPEQEQEWQEQKLNCLARYIYSKSKPDRDAMLARMEDRQGKAFVDDLRVRANAMSKM